MATGQSTRSSSSRRRHAGAGVQPIGTPMPPAPPRAAVTRTASDGQQAAFDEGFLLGILVGEGHFGGDGRQPQVTLRMHSDHAALFGWLVERFPGSRLYGPYDHAGRRYYQWMARGRFLRDALLPILRRRLRPEHSGRVWARYEAMLERYGLSGPDAGRQAAPTRPTATMACPADRTLPTPQARDEGRSS